MLFPTTFKLVIMATLLLLDTAWARLGKEDISHPRILESENNTIEKEFILVTSGDNDAVRNRIEYAGGSVVFTYEHIFQGMAVEGLDRDSLVQVMGERDDIISATPVREIDSTVVCLSS